MRGLVTAEPPFDAAVAAAEASCDGGTILYRPSDAAIDAALVLAPEVPLATALEVVLAAEVGFADAFGALAPPETALQIEWPGRFRLNGARCGRMRAAAQTEDPTAVPGWLALALEIAIAGDGRAEPGETPDRTTLGDEGVEVGADALLGAWARHTLAWIDAWEQDGLARIHAEWCARAWGLGRAVTVELPRQSVQGIFRGLGEHGGLLLGGDTVQLVPLTDMLERP